MDISLVAADTKEVFFDLLADCIDEKLANQKTGQLKAFTHIYYGQSELDELEGRPLNDVFGSAFGWWNFIQQWDFPGPKVRVFNPSLEEEGWLCAHTVIAVLQRDMPFLVDSIRIEVNRRNITLHEIKSTVMSVSRDKNGKLIDVVAKGQHPQDSKKQQYHHEAMVYLEINLHTNESAMQELADSLRSVLRDVDVVVSDYPPLLDQLQRSCQNLKKAQGKALTENISEAVDFLHWLGDAHFTILGFVEYEFTGSAKSRRLQEKTDSRLGLFRMHGSKPDSVKVTDFNMGMKQFHLGPQLISFTKSSVRSRVHRQSYSDYVVVKQFDDAGEVCGESRFMGLYTSPVYTASPSNIPLIKQKITHVLERSGLDLQSHDGKALKQVLETFPRDELFQSSEAELYETVMGVARIKERHRVKLFIRRDPYGKFVNCIVYVPRDDFSTQIRIKIQDIIGDAINAQEHEFTTYFSESVLARSHIVFKVDPSDDLDIDVKRLERQIVDITRSWTDRLYESLCDTYGEEKGARLYANFGEAFSSSYRETYEARAAVQDLETIAQLDNENRLAMSFYQPIGADKKDMRFKIFHLDKALELSEAIPVLENLGLRVIGEHPYRIQEKNGICVWMQDFGLRFGLNTEVDVHAVRHNFQDAFAAIWTKKTDSDPFNRLVLGARLNWREVSMLRAYASYMKQTMFNFSQSYIANTLSRHLDITRNLVALFKSTFDPRVNEKLSKDNSRIERLSKKIIDSLEKVDNLSEDRIIRRYLEFMQGTLRTNFYQLDSSGNPKTYISFKFNPRTIANIPEPRPMYEIFVYSPRMEGVHLRGGAVARGGLRWSDRLQDYRTEVLGLVKAQQVKNAVIVPSGAKGGFVAKKLPSSGGREAYQKEGIACYQTFIRGLLDITDNIVDGDIQVPEQVVRKDGDDPYLVVAADKGTATFSDIANEISKEYNHWLGDAFASGGSQGYDHKGMGITARGAWVSVQRHFKEKNINVQEQDFSVIGIGDMAGDVFGNGMLMSEHICLKAAFNHLHIFIDPAPNAASSFKERQRLFNAPAASWADYNKTLISKGGGVFPRSAKSVSITAEMKAAFGIEADKLTPNELIHGLLKAPVDLIWNGGIGTYVKSADENHADVGDKANDTLRVDGNQLRCQVFGEGGNLGMTQLGRIEYCLQGGRCNTDFIDNAAGVDCSDHEVNIKILLDGVVTNGDLTGKQRNKLLEEMTPTVSALVLNNNYLQTQAISLAEYDALTRVGEYRRFITTMVDSGRLDRALEFLPTDEQIVERQQQGKTLTRPELSVLISYAKVELKESLANEQLTDDAYMVTAIESAFPALLQRKYRDQIYSHRLRKEIVATQVANNMVNYMGINFCHRLIEATGASAIDVAKAYVAARDIYRLHDFFSAVEALDYKIDTQLQFKMQSKMMGNMRRATRWFLRNRRGYLSPANEVEAFAAPVQRLVDQLPSVMCGTPKEDWDRDSKQFEQQGIDSELASWAALPASVYSALNVVEAARMTEADPVDVASVYFALGDRLGLHWFAMQVSDVKVDTYWHAMAREAFMDDLESQMRTLATSIIRLSGETRDVTETLDRWSAQHSVLIGRWRSMITELQGSAGTDFAMFSVALRELLDLAQASQHCTSLDDDSNACRLGF
ncbi:NAD-glutamate dehydrogenase domain-containing protein [Pseudomaricurvus hydrocarbonicus]|uniref:NAD-glutamate dehydrogenase domain-containing protein n=1 Tax=Pseudomaricurvus hydrocarbonicus TaxID=1470433 RepID=UPI001AA0AC10